ncbi:hypothetical protein GLAREA_00507 [Glarea lozoyensis ATCC 20868]|uniref:Uncharacterized protein n=1 Tax=Glarea lozoyensis (strain ATCC 20868 / MF5171) TaxID=1116229 RepID=S3CSF2_GLAL2|nr:uncharacterized protein GLAREA_00507 [Glarea lozoyensis ATCC 20868]EPE29347.1 hypothetical protein GLAREA_00507 [Glarea lozoyensis ATCC 20868]
MSYFLKPVITEQAVENIDQTREDGESQISLTPGPVCREVNDTLPSLLTAVLRSLSHVPSTNTNDLALALCLVMILRIIV